MAKTIIITEEMAKMIAGMPLNESDFDNSVALFGSVTNNTSDNSQSSSNSATTNSNSASTSYSAATSSATTSGNGQSYAYTKGMGYNENFNGAPKPLNLSVTQFGMSTNWINQAAYNEAGRPITAALDDKHRYGVVVQNRKGQADNKGRHKTYGWGSLFDPYNHCWMDKTAGPDAVNFRRMGAEKTDEYLRKCFLHHFEKGVKKLRKWIGEEQFSKLYPNQVDAIVSIIGNFGFGGFKRLKVSKLIKKNPSDPAIYDVWVHSSDKQGHNGFGGLLKRRHGEADWYFGNVPTPYLKHIS